MRRSRNSVRRAGLTLPAVEHQSMETVQQVTDIAQRRSDLRVVITSATIDAERFGVTRKTRHERTDERQLEQAVERTMSPRLAAHQNAIYLNAALFARVDSLHARRDDLGLARTATVKVGLDVHLGKLQARRATIHHHAHSAAMRHFTVRRMMDEYHDAYAALLQ